VAVSGAVRSPESFDWLEGITLRNVVLKAGGLRGEVAPFDRVQVRRLPWWQTQRTV
jgi:protein involved in polysaccharide export with SLBB domain